jgi:hypothetical protein
MPRIVSKLCIVSKLFIGAAAVLVLLATPAAAKPVEPPPPPDDVTILDQQGSRVVFSGPLGRIYASVGSDFVIIAGGPVNEVCLGTPPATVGVAHQVGDGTWQAEIPNGGVERPVVVYEKDPSLDLGGYLGSVCPGIAGGGAAPDPIATGAVIQQARQRDLASPYWSFLGPQQPGIYRNSIRGWATASDGTRLRILASVYYEIDADGGFELFSELTKVQPVG